MDWLQFWYVFPFALLICVAACTLAMEGAVLFTPAFLYLFPAMSAFFSGLAPFPRFTPYEAIGVALIVEFFGYTSATIGYLRERLVDFKIARKILVLGIPIAVGTRLTAAYFPAKLLILLFSFILLILAVILARSFFFPPAGKAKTAVGSTCLISRRGKEYRYTFEKDAKDSLTFALASSFIGIIGVGMGEITNTLLLIRHRLPAQVAIGTSVFTVALTIFAAATTHVYVLVSIRQSLPWTLLLMLIPAVLIAGQIAPRICARTPELILRLALITIFIAASVYMFSRGFLTA